MQSRFEPEAGVRNTQTGARATAPASQPMLARLFSGGRRFLRWRQIGRVAIAQGLAIGAQHWEKACGIPTHCLDHCRCH